MESTYKTAFAASLSFVDDESSITDVTASNNGVALGTSRRFLATDNTTDDDSSSGTDVSFTVEIGSAKRSREAKCTNPARSS